jgi:hypothetical protein
MLHLDFLTGNGEAEKRKSGKAGKRERAGNWRRVGKKDRPNPGFFLQELAEIAEKRRKGGKAGNGHIRHNQSKPFHRRKRRPRRGAITCVF